MRVELRGEPLSERQIARLLGGMINTLLQMSDERTIRAQLASLAQSEDLWRMLRKLNRTASDALRESGMDIPEDFHP